MTLKNKLDASDEVELAHEEERVSKLAALSLYRDGTLDTLVPGTFFALKTIHVALFGDIYDFAGRIRTVNLAKGNFRFASAIYLESAIRSIETMPQENFDQIVEKYVEMNIAHPFRDGNGRSGRIWLDHMFRRELGRTVDWSRIGREDYLLAMERSPVRDLEIKALLRQALSDDLRSVAFLARSVDASFAYEGYDAYRAEDLGSDGASGAVR
ncbi:protein adenylyltransferase Fic [Tractidigestivibacter scatoligenes]|jgi:cell filamentation protein|uniref:protein adenylyltransferase Fic n=1 Tax=Tractidigestivibacter scatoligenes TaxID=1299998 RepID=UPI002F350C09